MNFYAKAVTGFKAGILPRAKLADGWRDGEVLWVKTASGWKVAWRRRIVYTNLVDLADANIFALMGSPVKPREYVFINKAVLRGVSAAALRTGVFPAGSKLLVINEGYIKGAGGAGGTAAAGMPGNHGLLLEFATTLDNSAGYIHGGGGGGGLGQHRTFRSDGSAKTGYGGAGGAGEGVGAARPGAAGQAISDDGSGGTGGAGAAAGIAGSPGSVGWSNTTYATYGPWPGGAPGAAIISGGHAFTFSAGNSSDRIKGAVS
jgi:hypothetical protein